MHELPRAVSLTPVGNATDDDDDDALQELSDAMPALSDDDGEQEELGIDEQEDLSAAEIDDGPEEVGLDVETLDTPGAELDLDGDDEESYALDDAAIDLEGELDDGIDEDGWTDESEGAGSSWDDEPLEDDEDAPHDDDGGLEGIEDPSLDDFIVDSETTLSIEGEDLNAEEEDLERVELDLG
jgi:hypothetical protein